MFLLYNAALLRETVAKGTCAAGCITLSCCVIHDAFNKATFLTPLVVRSQLVKMHPQA